jgi:TRAP-type C4-dicarboxylate transport system substrate-binding protein
MSRYRPEGPVLIAGRKVATRAFAIALILSFAATFGARAADDKTFVMKIALATVGDVLHEYAKAYAAAVEKDSGGRIKTAIYAASQLGSTEQQAESVQFGAIQCQVVPPDFLAGIDERFEVLAAPGLVTSIAQGQRLAADPAVRNLMLGLGSDKGLHGAGLFMVAPSSLVARTPIRHLADFKGKKIRILSSQFQSVAMRRLGATPKPMTLGDVLPALQDNVIDGAIGATSVFGAMHYVDVAKYVTEIGQPAIFAVTEISKKWYDSLPADLQQIVDKDAVTEAVAINPWVIDFNAKVRKDWANAGGELISLSSDEQTAMLKILSNVGDEVSNAKPQLSAAYQIVTEAAQRTR